VCVCVCVCRAILAGRWRSSFDSQCLEIIRSRGGPGVATATANHRAKKNFSLYITRAFFCRSSLRMGARRKLQTLARTGGREENEEVAGEGEEGARGIRSRGGRGSSDAEVRWTGVEIIYAAARARDKHAYTRRGARVYVYAEVNRDIRHQHVEMHPARCIRVSRLHVTFYARLPVAICELKETFAGENAHARLHNLVFGAINWISTRDLRSTEARLGDKNEP